ncbi:MAG: VPS10 domain-containing protein, partial [Terriglobales bacterium]
AAPGRGGRGAAPPKKGGVFRSLDQGQTWEHMSAIDPRPSYYSRIYVDPANPDRVYIMGSERGFYISDDAGRTFRDVFSRVHGEDHTMWIDPANSNHLLIGGDGGVSISYDKGQTWLFRDNLPIGQFYDISANHASPYLVCGGLQDNGNWCTPSATNLSYGLTNRDAFNVGGGDGMQAVFDGDNHTLLVSSQNGSTVRLDLDTMQRQRIGPVPPPPSAASGAAGGRGAGYRWYWTSPLIVSHFNPQVIYTAANILFRSDDQGRSWKAISGDLTAHVDRSKLPMMGGPVPADALSKNDGQDNFSALTVIAESPLDKNLLYTGADDGTLQRTRDGGAHWTNLTANVPGLPPMTNVSGIAPSRYAPGRVYATFDGHFNDDYHPYVYVSNNYGDTWTTITGGLPMTSVHRIRENPKNPDFLVAGLEEGVWASWDRGAHWTSLNTNLPPVPVYDLIYQASGALLLGTHGRGIWVLDNAQPLAQMATAVAASGVHLFPVPAAHRTTIYSPQSWFGWGEFFAPNPPSGAVATFYLAKASATPARVTITDARGAEVRSFTAPAHAGMNAAVWDLHYAPALPPQTGGRGGRGGGFGRGGGSGPWAPPGQYKLTLAVPGEAAASTSVSLNPDNAVRLSPAEQAQRQADVMGAYRLQQQLEPARTAAATVTRQLEAMRTYLDAVGAPGAAPLQVVARSRRALQPLSAQLERAISQAAAAQRAMDDYEGLPTAAQSAQLVQARQQARTAVAALNQFLRSTMSATYRAVGANIHWAPVPPLDAIASAAENRG